MYYNVFSLEYNAYTIVLYMNMVIKVTLYTVYQYIMLLPSDTITIPYYQQFLAQCICAFQSGDVFCEKKLCSQQCTHPVRYRNCCPVCDDCLFEGQKYGNTQTFYIPSDPCKRCVCHSGSVTCTVVACPVVSCQNPVTPPGQCCPQCRGQCVSTDSTHVRSEAKKTL